MSRFEAQWSRLTALLLTQTNASGCASHSITIGGVLKQFGACTTLTGVDFAYDLLWDNVASNASSSNSNSGSATTSSNNSIVQIGIVATSRGWAGARDLFTCYLSAVLTCSAQQ